MNIRKLPSIPLVLVTAAGVLACGSGDGEGADEAAADTEAARAAAETPDNPRFGVWQLESDRAPPYRNVMTYEPWGDGGMKITVATTNAEGETSSWGYTTMFDGEFSPVEGGGEGATTAVEVVDDRTNRILNARDGEGLPGHRQRALGGREHDQQRVPADPRGRYRKREPRGVPAHRVGSPAPRSPAGHRHRDGSRGLPGR